MRKALPWLVALATLVADRLTKIAVLHCLIPGTLVPLIPGLALTNVRNTGIAFSLFADTGGAGRLILQAAIAAAVIVIAWIVYRHGGRTILSSSALGLILGGAAGNLLDRILYGWVVDFIHLWVSIGGKVWVWPDFNIADSAITVGAGLLILAELRRPEGKHAPGID